MAGEDDNFLPNFCGITCVFAVVVGGELLAFVLTLVQPGGGSWPLLGMISLYVQWVGLGSAALLCLLRRRLVELGDIACAVASFALIMMVTLAVGSYVALRLRDSGATDMDWSWLLRSLLVSAIIAAAVLRHLYVQHHWRLRIQGAASARIDALQARIRPHFLFNSLNTIAATIATDPRRAESLVEDLSDLFRASLGQSRQVIPFSDEHRLALGYLEMEQLRMGDRLAIEQDLATIPEDALIPPLTLQPLLENAVYYGAEPSEAGATIRLKGRCRDGELILTVSNPSPPERARGRSGFGSAQANVGERLRLAFGERAQLSTHESEGVYCVTLRLPYRQGGVDEDLDR